MSWKLHDIQKFEKRHIRNYSSVNEIAVKANNFKAHCERLNWISCRFQMIGNKMRKIDENMEKNRQKPQKKKWRKIKQKDDAK